MTIEKGYRLDESLSMQVNVNDTSQATQGAAYEMGQEQMPSTNLELASASDDIHTDSFLEVDPQEPPQQFDQPTTPVAGAQNEPTPIVTEQAKELPAVEIQKAASEITISGFGDIIQDGKVMGRLSIKEQELYEFMMNRKGTLATGEEIAEALWQGNIDQQGVAQTLKRLAKKLPEPLASQFLRLPRAGYGFVEDKITLQQPVNMGEIAVDLHTGLVQQQQTGDITNRLTTQEIALMRFLIEHEDVPLTNKQIAEAIHPESELETYIEETNVSLIIHKIRQKLGAAGKNNEFIHTEPGIGFSFRRSK